jgi:hypothetical protein
MRGGVANIFILVAVFVCVFIAISFVRFNTFWAKGEAERVSVQENIYSMDYALDAAKTYLKTALHYSVYQACYDNLGSGGFSVPNKKHEYGGKFYSQLAKENEFINNLKSQITENFKTYTSDTYSFYEAQVEHDVKLPDYKQITFSEIKTNFITIIADSDERLAVTDKSESMIGNEIVKLEKLAYIGEDIFTDCYGIYQKGVATEKVIANSLEQIVANRLPADETISGVANNCENLSTNIKGKTTTEYAKEISDSIKSDINSMPKTDGEYPVNSELIKSDVTAKLTETLSDSTTKEIHCAVDYAADINMLVTITGSKEVPIYNGADIVFEKLTLVYVVEYK